MPVELNIVESVTELDTTVVEVNLVSASEPGPAGPGVPTGGTDGQVLTKTSATDYATAWEDPTGGGGGGAPTDATYLVTTANGDLSAEVVVGAAPGGELGGTWASPTVDATHSGSSHASVQAAAEATAAAALLAHTTDSDDAHDASAISIADAGGDFTATDVEGALAELQADHETDASALTTHEADTTSIHGIPDTSVLETTTGAQTKVDTHVNDGAGAHAASAISVLDTNGDYTATDVEGVLAEIAPQLGGGGTELDYAQITSNVTVSATAAATPTDIVAVSSRSYDGTTSVLVHFFCEEAVCGAGSGAFLIINLWDGSTDLGRIGQIRNTTAGQQLDVPVSLYRRLTPSNGSHTYSIKAWRVTANGQITAGVGGVDTPVPAFLRVVAV